jgi:hypothetical protein
MTRERHFLDIKSSNQMKKMLWFWVNKLFVTEFSLLFSLDTAQARRDLVAMKGLFFFTNY